MLTSFWICLFFSHVEYDVGGVKHMRMKFYIEGQHRKATVNLEMKQVKTFFSDLRYTVLVCKDDMF